MVLEKMVNQRWGNLDYAFSKCLELSSKCDYDALKMLSLMYSRGVAAPYDLDKAIYYAEELSNYCPIDGIPLLLRLLENKGVGAHTRIFELALNFYNDYHYIGGPYLARCFFNGFGTEKDVEYAIKLYTENIDAHYWVKFELFDSVWALNNSNYDYVLQFLVKGDSHPKMKLRHARMFLYGRGEEKNLEKYKILTESTGIRDHFSKIDYFEYLWAQDKISESEIFSALKVIDRVNQLPRLIMFNLRYDKYPNNVNLINDLTKIESIPQ